MSDINHPGLLYNVDPADCAWCLHEGEATFVVQPGQGVCKKHLRRFVK